MAVCRREAIYRDSRLDRVLIDYDRCISCRMCMAVCPFGALGFESGSGGIDGLIEHTVRLFAAGTAAGGNA